MYYLITLMVIGITLVIPAFLGDFFPAHDLLYHLNWNKFFVDQFWAGDLYPRWLMGMNGGQGSPAFFFYGPIPYYAAALFKPFLADDPYGWLQLGLSFSLALGLSGIFSFLWLQKITDKTTAFLGALFYMLLPYHLQVDLFHRLALAEFWAFAWMPLILYAVTEIVSGSKTGSLKLAIGYSLLIMTHLSTTLIFSPLPLLYAWVLSDRDKKLKVAFNVLSGMIFGLCLSAVYLLPVLMTQDNVVLSRMTEGRGRYDQGFLISGEILQPIPWQGYWEFLSRSTLFTMMVSIIFIVPSWLSRNPLIRRIGIFWCSVSVIAAFMMYPWSDPLWRMLPTLQKIQFPWRFNMILSVAASASIVIGLYALKNETSRYERIARVFIFSIVIALAIIAGNLFLERSTRQLEPENLAIILHSLQFNEGASEYLPRWVPDEMVSLVDNRTMKQTMPKLQVVAGDGRTQIRKWQPRHIEIFVQAQKKILLEVGQFFYPGWTAKAADGNTPYPLSPSGHGTLEIHIPEGEHLISITLDAGREEVIGRWVSLVSLIALIIWYGYIRSERKSSFFF